MDTAFFIALPCQHNPSAQCPLTFLPAFCLLIHLCPTSAQPTCQASWPWSSSQTKDEVSPRTRLSPQPLSNLSLSALSFPGFPSSFFAKSNVPPLPHYHSSLLGSASTSSDSISLLSLSLSVPFLSPWLAQLPLLMLPRLTALGNIGAKTKGLNHHIPPSCHSTVGSHLHQEGLALWQDGNTGQSQLLCPAKMPPAAHCESLKPLLKFWKSSMNGHRADFFLCNL